MSESKRQLIDRRQLLRFFTISPSGERYSLKNIDGFPVEVRLEAVQKKIREAQVIDAVEVVRCKDCKFKDGETPGQPNILCYHMKDDDFCSYGERK